MVSSMWSAGTCREPSEIAVAYKYAREMGSRLYSKAGRMSYRPHEQPDPLQRCSTCFDDLCCIRRPRFGSERLQASFTGQELIMVA